MHPWQLSVADAIETQRKLSAEVLRKGTVVEPRFIAGVDVSAARGRAAGTAAVVVLTYPEVELVEVRVAQGVLDFPYVPGLLSFREAPLILEACRALTITPDLVLVDGQGIAHPRRIGLASHLGLLLDVPTIGCAKSRLCGRHEMPPTEPGSYAEVKDGGETIGVALRTRAGIKPIYVSVGHRIDLTAAVELVLGCCRGYRLPEPTRLAHQAAAGRVTPGSGIAVPG